MKTRSSVVLTLLAALACAEAKAPRAELQHGYVPQGDGAATTVARRATPAAAAGVELASASHAAMLARDSAAMIIRTATASVEVDSLDVAVAAVRGLVARVEGYVANVKMEAGRQQLRSATLTLKIPAPRFEDAVAGLAPIGKLESVDVSATDVGEEYVDVAARIENSRRLERRLVELLATRTGRLKDVLDVERELARVRESIERHEGRLRYLRANVAMSTLSVHVHEPRPVVGSAGTSVIGEAFTQAWRNFVTLLAVGIQSLGVVIPLGLVAVGAWLTVRRYRRLFQRAA